MEDPTTDIALSDGLPQLTPAMQRHVDRTLAADRKGGEALWEKACAVADARADAKRGEWGAYLTATGQNERSAQRLIAIADRGRAEARFRDAVISGWLSFSVAALTAQADDQLIEQLLTAPTPPTVKKIEDLRNPTTLTGFSDEPRNPTTLTGFSDETANRTPVSDLEPEAPAATPAQLVCKACGAPGGPTFNDRCLSCYHLDLARKKKSGPEAFWNLEQARKAAEQMPDAHRRRARLAEIADVEAAMAPATPATLAEPAQLPAGWQWREGRSGPDYQAQAIEDTTRVTKLCRTIAEVRDDIDRMEKRDALQSREIALAARATELGLHLSESNKPAYYALTGKGITSTATFQVDLDSDGFWDLDAALLALDQVDDYLVKTKSELIEAQAQAAGKLIIHGREVALIDRAAKLGVTITPHGAGYRFRKFGTPWGGAKSIEEAERAIELMEQAAAQKAAAPAPAAPQLAAPASPEAPQIYNADDLSDEEINLLIKATIEEALHALEALPPRVIKIVALCTDLEYTPDDPDPKRALREHWLQYQYDINGFVRVILDQEGSEA